jgi:hypothetical protein
VKELTDAAQTVPKLWAMVAGYPLWVKCLAVIVIVVVGLIILQMMQGEGGD